jgi:hypothetical protein
MKIFRYLLLAVLFLGYRAVAHAYAVIINDPSTGSPTFFVQPGVPFSFNFTTCSVTVDGMLMTGCAEGQNNSNVTLTNIILNYSDTGIGNPVCSSNAYDHLNCGPSSNGVFTLSFADHTGGDDNGCDADDDDNSGGTGIHPGCDIFFYENGAPGSQFPTVSGIANTPEPGSIWLALSGLGSAGYLIRRRRKNLTV